MRKLVARILVQHHIAMLIVSLMASTLFAQSDAETKSSDSRGNLIVLIGSAGEEEYQTQFNAWAAKWEQACQQGHLQATILGANSAGGATLIELQTALRELEKDDSFPLWLVLVGHGTFDGQTAKFNLQGPDLTPTHLSEELETLTRPIAIINCASASGEFIDTLTAANRVIITATKSGQEINFARFGEYLASSISDPAADLDKDEQTSLLEAFLFANRQTEEFYKNDGLLASEHALLEDNSDGRGTRGAAFRGVRAIAEPNETSAILDGLRAHQWHLIANNSDSSLSIEIIQKRNALELQLAELQSRKSEMVEDEYYSAVEKIFVELANLLALHGDKTEVSE